MITIQRTVNIPADRRVTFDIPLEIPTGKTSVVLMFPQPEAASPLDREPWIPIVSWLRRRREERFRRAVMQVAGKFAHVFDEDGVTLQRRWRDEWDNDDA